MKAVHSIHQAQGGRADNGAVYLMAGDHEWGRYSSALESRTEDAWLTIRPAPGLTREQVRITSASDAAGLKLALVHAKDLTVFETKLTASGTNPAIWLEGCVMRCAQPATQVIFAPAQMWAGGVFVTDCEYRDTFRAAMGTTIVRNTLIDGVGADALRMPKLVANVEIRNVLPVGRAAHRDICQFTDSCENVIVYGLRAVENISAQGIFARRATNNPGGRIVGAAFVNYLVRPINHYGQWSMPADHILMWHFEFLGRPFRFREDGDGLPTHLSNISVRNSVFEKFNYYATTPATAALSMDNNHFIRDGGFGTRATAGDPLFADASAGDFRPMAGSLLRNRVSVVLVPGDLSGEPVPEHGSIGVRQP